MQCGSIEEGKVCFNKLKKQIVNKTWKPKNLFKEISPVNNF